MSAAVSVGWIAHVRAAAARRAWRCAGECGGGQAEIVIFDEGGTP